MPLMIDLCCGLKGACQCMIHGTFSAGEGRFDVVRRLQTRH